jgi:hypothetical protein
MLLCWVFTSTGQAQSQTEPDSVVALVADAQGLPFVPAENRPVAGTYWEVRNSLPCVTVPLPCPPFDPNTPVYALGGGHFLADETAGTLIPPLPAQYRRRTLGTADYAAIAQAQVGELQELAAQFQAWQQNLELRRNSSMSMLESEPPPVPGGEGGGTNVWYGGGTVEGPVPGTNDFYFGGISISVSNATAILTIHHPETNTTGVYDLYSTTNLVPAWWSFVRRCDPGQTSVVISNLTAASQFYILGTTNDSDQGGMSDAYEGLLGLNPADATDDHTNPVVGIFVVDSVAVEQQVDNTAKFRITRLGGHMTSPLTVALQLSGTAVLSVNYTLSPLVGSTGTTVWVTIPAFTNSQEIILAPVNDHVANGTKTATLTLGTDPSWSLDPAHTNATAWILEQYSHTYTYVADFTNGVLEGLEAVATGDDGHLQFKTNLQAQFPFISIACSERGTVARINTSTGAVVGEYRTAPDGLTFTLDDGPGPEPSRTTVDQYGNVWVANRDDDRLATGATNGSITRIGLTIGGSRFEKVGTNYVADTNGHYIALSNATYNTCIDRDGDGFIRTSTGLSDILPWLNGGGADSEGGVSTAEDEAITEYTRVPSTGTRTIAVDRFNDIWVGGHSGARTHLKVNGLLGEPVPHSAFGAGLGGYGGVIDGQGNLWSSDGVGNHLLWLVPPTNFPPRKDTNWFDLSVQGPSGMYGIAVDPLYPYIWQTTGWDSVFRWHTNGTPATNADGSLPLFYHGGARSQGLAVDTNGHVWVAHSKIDSSSHTVGHLNTNGTLVGVVDLEVSGLFAEYFANTNLNGGPLRTNVEGPVDFSWTNVWPASGVPTNAFSARWSGIVKPQAQGEHVFYVSADAGAAFRLRVNGVMIIDNWTNPVANPGELAGTNWLGTNTAYDLTLEYAHFSAGAQVRLSWLEPGSTKQVIPLEGFQHLTSDQVDGATGISVDAAGKIWAGCYDSSTAVRIDPNAGPMVVTTNEVVVSGSNITVFVTNHVGLVDMVVELGNELGDPAHPYNYSDMTGFNVRVVNPSLQPLKGYWMVIHDSGLTNEFWQRVSWTASLTNGCSVEVYVRAADDRVALARNTFTAVSNNVPSAGVNGRYLELRVAMTRNDATNDPALYDLTLYGFPSTFGTDTWLDDVWTNELQSGVFSPVIVGPQPMTYQWYVQYPWMKEWDWTLAVGATNAQFTITNVDSWVNSTMVMVLVTDATGESLWLGPAALDVVPLTIVIPGSGSSGAASRYPATINVFGLPTNLGSVIVTNWDLSHQHPGDIDLLLVSPSGTNVMLMSHVGGTNAVSDANLVFQQYYLQPSPSDPLRSGQTSFYQPSNYGGRTNLPGAPSGPYSTNLDDLIGTNPNGTWELYIYDEYQGGVGQLYFWRLGFTFQ